VALLAGSSCTAVDAAAMAAGGHDVTKRGVATYITDRVPPRYIVCHDQ
jgi:RNA:NAD 2'-phosphotransferase (TPT1/KptA family)